MVGLNIEIESIKTIKLTKNESLVFKLGGNLTLKEVRAFKKQLITAVPSLKDKVVVLHGDIEVFKV